MNNNKNKNTKSEKNPKAIKTKEKTVRKKNDREALKGYECSCCKPFYDALGLATKNRAYLVQIGSRHRYPSTPPKSPNKKFWNIGFSNNEQ